MEFTFRTQNMGPPLEITIRNQNMDQFLDMDAYEKFTSTTVHDSQFPTIQKGKKINEKSILDSFKLNPVDAGITYSIGTFDSHQWNFKYANKLKLKLFHRICGG